MSSEYVGISTDFYIDGSKIIDRSARLVTACAMKAKLKVNSSRKTVCFSLSLYLGTLLFGTQALYADTNLIQSGEITINPSSTEPTLTLAGPAFDSASATNYGLVLSYHDSTSTVPTATSVIRIYRPTGQYQWQFSTSNSSGTTNPRLAMQLGDNHWLTLFDPANASNTIVLHPGTDLNSGVFWNGQRLATASEIASNFVPLTNGGFNVGGAVTIGTTTTPAALTVNGATTTSRLNLPATTDANTGVIYQDGGWFLHSNGTNNFFAGAYAGNLGQSIGVDNVGVGSGALVSLSTGVANVAVGHAALISNQTGGANIAIGDGAMYSVVSNSWNIAIGHGAGYSIVGDYNVVVGYHAGQNLTTGGSNTAMGSSSLAAINGNPISGTGYENSAFGLYTLLSATSGSGNTAIGSQAGAGATSGSNNIFVGWKSGHHVTTGNGNIIIGSDIDFADPTTSQQLSIGNLIYGVAVDGTGTTPSSGKIGIGTAAPAAKLDVNGDARFAGRVRIVPQGDIDMGAFTHEPGQ